jgi:hypothetical protein
MTDACGLLRTRRAVVALVSVFASSGRWPHSGYESRASLAEGAGLKAQGAGSLQIAVPAWN